MNNSSIYKIPYDIVEYITSYLDNRDYLSCLLSSKIFNLRDLNKVTYYRYMYRKYKDENINHLSEDGDLEGIKFLTFIGSACTIDAMDLAAQNGHLEIIEWLHENIKGYACTTDAMNWAACNGHLEIVKFLHENRNDIKGVACTTSAMDGAAKYGNLDVVKWLHENGYTCTTYAIDSAAENGHLEIVKWLHENGFAYTKFAMVRASENGHFEIVKFLY